MKIFRWIIFVPATILISVICDVLLKLILNAVSFFWDSDSAGQYSRYGEGIESYNVFALILFKFMIPAISFFIAVMIGTYIAPNNRKIASIILVVLSCGVSILVLFTEYSSLLASIASISGAIIAYWNLKEKEFAID